MRHKIFIVYFFDVSFSSSTYPEFSWHPASFLIINPEQEKHAGNKFRNDDDSKKALEVALQKINTLEENKKFLQNKLTQYGTQLRIFIKEKEGKQTS